jgi:hypothetical protein
VSAFGKVLRRNLVRWPIPQPTGWPSR